MGIRVLKIFYKILIYIYNFLRNILNYIIIRLKIRKNIKWKNIDIGNEEEIFILMNGPSLKVDLTKMKKKIKNKSVLCVNNIVNTEYFETLKPRFYAIADSKFWNPIKTSVLQGAMEEQQAWNQIAVNLVKKTKWKMILFIPKDAMSYIKLIELLNTNPNIEIVFTNMILFPNTFEKFKFKFWKKQYCVPYIANVLAYSIYLMLIINYKNIYLLGVDHTFFSNLKVDKDNKVYWENKHIYEEKKAVKHIFHPDGSEVNMGRFLEENANIWKTYYELDKFSKYCNSEIYNCTENSLIDAFKRI